jgi:DNA polymerase-1
MEISRRVTVHEKHYRFSGLLADLIAYRISFACKDESETHAKYSLNNYVNDILVRGVDKAYPSCFVDQWKFYLTGGNNYRFDIAKTAVYKGNRLAPKPQHLPALRQHLVDEWGAVVIEGSEADDAVATHATELGYNNSIITSVDKDLDQIPGWHYNFVKDIAYHITPEEGMYRFYKQILTGDSADNIIGLKGVGPVKADKILDECETEVELYNACLLAYDGNEERVLENARLLWLRRYEGQMWEPPKE